MKTIIILALAYLGYQYVTKHGSTCGCGGQCGSCPASGISANAGSPAQVIPIDSGPSSFSSGSILAHPTSGQVTIMPRPQPISNIRYAGTFSPAGPTRLPILLRAPQAIDLAYRMMM